MSDGLCKCGCGRETKVSPRNDARRGYIKGQPLRFVCGHSSRCWQGPRFKVDPKTGCWLWLGATNPGGYGLINVNGRCRLAHRWMFEERVGPIPRSKMLDHLCRNPACVNPEHLEVVSNAENTRRGNRPVLTIEQAAAVRLMRGEYPDMSHRQLAEMFSVDHRTIGRILKEEAWNHSK